MQVRLTLLPKSFHQWPYRFNCSKITSIPGCQGGLEKCHSSKWLLEEATGTWCGWCPRGAVNMENERKNITWWIHWYCGYNEGQWWFKITMMVWQACLGFMVFHLPIIKWSAIEDPCWYGNHTLETFVRDYGPVAVNATGTFNGRTITVDASSWFQYPICQWILNL